MLLVEKLVSNLKPKKPAVVENTIRIYCGRGHCCFDISASAPLGYRLCACGWAMGPEDKERYHMFKTQDPKQLAKDLEREFDSRQIEWILRRHKLSPE